MSAKYRIIIVNIHGLLKGSGLEIGRDADNGGQTRYVYELAEFLSQHQDVEMVHIFTRLIKDPKLSDEYSIPIEIINDKLDIRRISFAGNRYRMKEELWDYLDDFVARAIKHIKSHHIYPDWIHSHYGDAGYVATELSNLLKIPFVHIAKKGKLEAMGLTKEEGEKKFKFSKRIAAEENLLNHVSFVIVSTKNEIETYREYQNYSEAEFKILAPGVDTTKFAPYYNFLMPTEDYESETQRKYWVGEYIEKFLSQPQKPVILALSRPDRRKNLHTLIEVFGKDKQLQSIANLIIFAGIRKDIEQMNASEKEVLVEILLLMDKFDLYGKLAIPKKHDVENEVATIYRYCAEKRGVFVNLALHENFGLTNIEAASSGLPVVSTQNGGPAEVIPTLNNGILVNPMETGEIKNAIVKILTDPELWKEYSNQGIINVGKHYSWSSHVDNYIDWIKNKVFTEPEAEMISKKLPSTYRQRIRKMDHLFAADIDGTLIYEDQNHPGLEEMRKFLESRPEHMGFALASGRALHLIEEAIDKFNLPSPDFIISAVGSQIYYGGRQFVFDKAWSRYLDKNWDRSAIAQRLRSLDWLTLQEPEAQNPHKLSYYYEPENYKEWQMKTVLGKLWENLNIIVSHNAFIDILPKRASKGKAIRYLSKKWVIPMSNVYTAGDSGNDLDMLLGPARGIIVGNRSEELLHLNQTKNLFIAEGMAAEGVLEGLRHYGVISDGIES
jgi:sucrose-phosphate synthase